MNLLALGLAVFIGLSLGFLGGGGSILTVPILVYVSSFEAKQAIAMSLPIVGTTSLVGALTHWRAGNVRFLAALPFALSAMSGAFLGARISGWFSGSAQLALLGLVMLASSILLFLKQSKTGDVNERTTMKPHPFPLTIAIPLGFMVGLLTGLIGIGGGFLIVPALVLFAKMPMKQAIGTSLFVIALNGAAGFVGYAGHVPIPWGYTMTFAGVAIGGILAGSYLVRFASSRLLQTTFAVFLLVVAAFVLFQNRQAFHGGWFTGRPAAHHAGATRVPTSEPLFLSIMAPIPGEDS